MIKIGFVGAMDMEIAPILKSLKDRYESKSGPFVFFEGEIANVPVVICRIGISKVNAAMSTQALLDRYDLSLVVHVGVGGSLTKTLSIGDIVIADGCVQYDVDTTALGDPPGFVSTVNRVEFPCDHASVEAIMDAADGLPVKVICGRVATGDRFLTNPEEKRAIAGRFGALICDQESCAVAQVCCVNGVPCAVIRAVSDVSDGKHADEYENFAPKAAQNAAELALRFVKNYGEQIL